MAFAVAVPALVLFVYITDAVVLSPPAPVTVEVHGVRAFPVYVWFEQVIVVVVVAFEIVKLTCTCGAAAIETFPS